MPVHPRLRSGVPGLAGDRPVHRSGCTPGSRGHTRVLEPLHDESREAERPGVQVLRCRHGRPGDREQVRSADGPVRLRAVLRGHRATVPVAGCPDGCELGSLWSCSPTPSTGWDRSRGYDGDRDHTDRLRRAGSHQGAGLALRDPPRQNSATTATRARRARPARRPPNRPCSFSSTTAWVTAGQHPPSSSAVSRSASDTNGISLAGSTLACKETSGGTSGSGRCRKGTRTSSCSQAGQYGVGMVRSGSVGSR